MENTILRMNETKTKTEALLAADLAWTVSSKPVFDHLGREIYGQRAIVRDDNQKVFKIVSDKYVPFQNDALLNVIDQFLETGGAKYTGLKSFKGGARILGRVAVPDGGFEVVPGDRCNTFLQFETSHDGSAAIRITPYILRLVCLNGMTRWTASDVRTVSARHTGHAAEFLIQNAAGVLNREIEYFRAFSKQCEALASKEFDKLKMESFLVDLFEEQPEEMAKVTRNKCETIAYLARRGVGQDIPGVKGTAWAAYNGVTEFLDHKRGNDAEAREYVSLYGSGKALRERAFDLLTSDKY